MAKKSDQLLMGGPPVGGSTVKPIGPPAASIDPATGQPVQIQARYYDGSEWMPASWAPGDIATLQASMRSAGVLRSSYRAGVWDDASREAYKKLLGHANATGTDDLGALRAYMAAPEIGDPEEVKPYLPPDRDTIISTVRTAVKRKTGRDVTSQELRQLADVMEGLDRQDYDADVAGVRDVDPIASFDEYLENQYRPEINMRQGAEDLSANRENLFGSILNLDRMIGA